MAEATVECSATGRRKEAVARVRLVAGTGELKINRRQMEDYFPSDALRITIRLSVRSTSAAPPASHASGGAASKEGERASSMMGLAVTEAMDESMPSVKVPGPYVGNLAHSRHSAKTI